MTARIAIDIAEFLSNPVRTGIQRVVRQVIAHWPADIARVFARYDPERDGLVEVPDRVVRFVCRESEQDLSTPEQIARHALLLQDAADRRPIALAPGDKVREEDVNLADRLRALRPAT